MVGSPMDSPSWAILLRIQVLLALKKGELLQKGFMHSEFGQISTKGVVLWRDFNKRLHSFRETSAACHTYSGCSNGKNCNGSNLMCSVKFSQRFPSAMTVTSRSNWLGGERKPPEILEDAVVMMMIMILTVS